MVFAAPPSQLSSPGIAVRRTASLPLAYAGRSSIPEVVGMESRGLSVLDTPLSRGMTVGRARLDTSPALSLPHDIPTDSLSCPHPRYRSRPTPHRLGRHRGRWQPPGLYRLRFGGTAGRRPAGEPPVGNSRGPR